MNMNLTCIDVIVLVKSTYYTQSRLSSLSWYMSKISNLIKCLVLYVRVHTSPYQEVSIEQDMEPQDGGTSTKVLK